MEDSVSGSEEDYCYSPDREAESSDGIENEDSDAQCSPSKASSCKERDHERVSLGRTEGRFAKSSVDLISLREQHARTLLIHHRWDVEKLIAVYVEKGKAFLFSEAGVTADEFIDLDPLEPSSTVKCNICMDDVPAQEVTTMECGHCFCDNCKHISFYWLCSRAVCIV